MALPSPVSGGLPEIANCTLLFGCGHDAAFPVDVWMERALRRMKKRTNFGPYAGWAQQYLFYNERRAGGPRSVVATSGERTRRSASLHQ